MPSSGDLPNPGMEPRSPALQADSVLSKPPYSVHLCALPIYIHVLIQGYIHQIQYSVLWGAYSATFWW